MRSREQRGARPKPCKKSILVVDDEPEIRTLFNDLLSGEGYRVLEAASAGAVHDILLKEPVDLVLLDIALPGIDGRLISRYLQVFYEKIKVIVTSIHPIDEQQQMISRADGYYEKSQDLDMLLEKINRVLLSGAA